MKLHHVGIVVRELEEAVERFRLLGFRETARGFAEAFGVAISWLEPKHSPEVEAEAPALELLQPLGDGPVRRFLEKRGEGLHHVAFAVPSIESKLKELKAQGVPLVDEAPREGFRGHKVAFVHPRGFHGVLVELVEEPRPGG